MSVIPILNRKGFVTLTNCNPKKVKTDVKLNYGAFTPPDTDPDTETEIDTDTLGPDCKKFCYNEYTAIRSRFLLNLFTRCKRNPVY